MHFFIYLNSITSRYFFFTLSNKTEDLTKFATNYSKGQTSIISVIQGHDNTELSIIDQNIIKSKYFLSDVNHHLLITRNF